MRQRWREVADDISYNKSKEIMLDDAVKFVEARARVLNPPMFGKLTYDSRNKAKEIEQWKRQSFCIDVRSNSQEIQQEIYSNVLYVTATIFSRSVVTFRKDPLKEERRLFVNVDYAITVFRLVILPDFVQRIASANSLATIVNIQHIYITRALHV